MIVYLYAWIEFKEAFEERLVILSSIDAWMHAYAHFKALAEIGVVHVHVHVKTSLEALVHVIMSYLLLE